MKLEHKKLIAREILWFAAFLIGLFSLVLIMDHRLLFERAGDLGDALIILVALYFLRAIGWAIKILFFIKKN